MKNDFHLRRITISVISIIILIISLITISYASFNFKKIGSHTNNITTGNVNFTYTEDNNAISLVNSQPIADDIAKNLTYISNNEKSEKAYFDFTLSNNSSFSNNLNYEIYLTIDNALDKRLDSKYVKVYLTSIDQTEQAVSGFNQTIPVIDTLQTIDSIENSKSLYLGTLATNESKNFRLRIWLSEDFISSDISYNYKIKVNVRTIY